MSLGEEHTVSFKAPGAVSHARWMAKAIYALKIWLFRAHFRLTKVETRRLPIFCQFVLQIHIEAWFQSSLPISAPRNDLSLMKKLLDLSRGHQSGPNPYLAAAKKLSSHLWYLSEEQVALAFFDPDVSCEEKRLMSEAMKVRHGAEGRTPRLQIAEPSLIADSRLSDFVNKNTRAFFKITGISEEFLEEGPENWHANEDYINACETLGKLKVINDVAERGVALIKTYNKLLTRDEEQLQFLLQVVGEHRRLFPDSRKSTIIQSFPE